MDRFHAVFCAGGTADISRWWSGSATTGTRRKKYPALEGRQTKQASHALPGLARWVTDSSGDCVLTPSPANVPASLQDKIAFFCRSEWPAQPSRCAFPHLHPSRFSAQKIIASRPCARILAPVAHNSAGGHRECGPCTHTIKPNGNGEFAGLLRGEDGLRFYKEISICYVDVLASTEERGFYANKIRGHDS